MTLDLEGNVLEALFSVLLSKRGGVVGRVADEATQPEVEAVPLVSANCLNTSLLTGSTGLASNGRAKRATWLPKHLVRDVGAVGDSKQDKQLPSDF